LLSADARARNEEAAHHRAWRDVVTGMMAGPCSSVEYANVFPGDLDWG